MFNHRRIKELECQVASLEEAYRGLCIRQRDLHHEHLLLLEHLGLIQQEIPQRTILTTKGGPEYENACRWQQQAMRGQAAVPGNQSSGYMMPSDGKLK